MKAKPNIEWAHFCGLGYWARLDGMMGPMGGGCPHGRLLQESLCVKPLRPSILRTADCFSVVI